MKKNLSCYVLLASLPSLMCGCSSAQHKGEKISLDKAMELIESFGHKTAKADGKVICDVNDATGLFQYVYSNGVYDIKDVEVLTLDDEMPFFDTTIDDEDCEIYLSEDELELNYSVKPDTLKSYYSEYLETLPLDEKALFESELNNMKGEIKVCECVNLEGLPIYQKYQMNVSTTVEIDGETASSSYNGTIKLEYSNLRDIKEASFEEATTPEVNSHSEANFDRKEWLRSIPDNMPISNINLPGTHDGTTGFIHAMAGLGLPKTQNKGLPEQFDIGVRYIDMRLLYTASKSGNTFDKLGFGHGDAKFGAFYSYKSTGAAVLGKVEGRLSFNDAVDMGREFLERHPSEFLIYQIKGEVNCKDDRKKHSEVYTTKWMEEQAYNRARELATGNPFRYMCIDNMSSSTDVYTLSQVRGKIIFSINIDGGYSHSMYGSQSAVCDDYDKGYNKKIGDLREVFHESTVDITTNSCKFWNYSDKSNNYNPRIIHCSCYRGPSYGLLNPLSCSNRVNPFVANTTFDKGKKYGWVLFDYVNDILTDKIIATNPNI